MICGKKGGYRMFKVLSRSSENCRPKVAITKNRYGHKFQNIASKTLVVYVFRYGTFEKG